MKTLGDAWAWFRNARNNLERMQRIGSRYWDAETIIDTTIWQDERFKRLESEDIIAETTIALEPLNDLGILVLFSVFESAVRSHLESTLTPIISTLENSLLQQAGEDLLEGIRQGSFTNNVLTPLKVQRHLSPELCDKVKQVRDYRNWVAHGKRMPKPESVINLTVSESYLRLKEFLDLLGVAVQSEQSVESEIA